MDDLTLTEVRTNTADHDTAFLQTKPERCKRVSFGFGTVEDVHAIVDVLTPDATGRARQVAELIGRRGGKIVAAHGCHLGEFYNRRCLIESTRRSIDKIQADIDALPDHILNHAQVLEPRLTWTFSASTEYYDDDASVDADTNIMFERVNGNVEWELKERRNAPNSTEMVLHQSIVTTLPSTDCLAQLDREIQQWRQRYGQHNGELLPGVCLAII